MNTTTNMLPTKPLVLALRSLFGVDLCFVELDPQDPTELGYADGMTIRISTSLRNTPLGSFVAAHLFGHMAQLSSPHNYHDLLDLADGPKPIQAPEQFWRDFQSYEVEGFAIGFALLQEAYGANTATRLKVAYEKFLSLDLHSFYTYLATGERTPVGEFTRKLALGDSERTWPLLSLQESGRLPSAVQAVKRIDVV